jgi:hypothetical protein
MDNAQLFMGIFSILWLLAMMLIALGVFLYKFFYYLKKRFKDE